jgi:colanic acid/amylovoran biosynthesis glycosyltransferase
MENHLIISEKKSDEKLIYFLCNGFPTISETFIIGQISNALNNDFSINVYAEYINYLDKPLLENDPSVNEIFSKIYIRCHAPDNKIKRIFLAMILATKKSAVISLIKSINPFRFGISALNLRNFFSYSSFLGAKKPDLVHAQFGPNGIIAINAKLNNVITCPIVTSFHGYDAHTEPSTLNKTRKLYFNLFKHGELFLVNGDYLKKQLICLGCPSSKIVKLPFGVDLNKFKPSPLRSEIGKDKVKLITIGRLIKLKNQEFGIKLLSLVRSKGINASYTIIGSGPEIDNLKKLAKSLGVDKYVQFLGSLPQEEILKILPQHHIFLMTSYKDAAGRMETQGIVSAEAQACGLPVITLGFGGTADTIIHGATGYNLSSSNPETAVSYLKELIEPSTYNKFSINARNFISKKYDIEITNRHLIKIYRDLIVKTEHS